MLTDQHGRVLIQLARQTIEEHLGMKPENPVAPELLADPALQEKRAVFVTLNKRGQLRGCIGCFTATESIVEGIKRHALNAAFNDYRFSPVTREEVPNLEIDISLLTEPQPLSYRDSEDLLHKLRPKIDGVILKHPTGASATFLPQVWEQLPSTPLFLGHLCRKAGLAETEWCTGSLAIQVYQVQYFKEKNVAA
ncbi:MAG: AmmeMemoRadiSam system protein A [Desulfobulbaceae bacterium]|nr:AmmeMemoRadiSam system protein A [Desulfobulbaceae bacterium]